jgi:hypothetical protein
MLRQTHNMLFGRSDIFMVCKLNPINSNINEMKPIIDTDEIEDAKWMDLNEFENTNKVPMIREVINLLKTNNSDKGFIESNVTSIHPTVKSYNMYHPKI